MQSPQNSVPASYLGSTIHFLKYYKGIAEKSMQQLTDQDLFWQPNEASNSIAVIIKHLAGNMLSRWTDFRTTDGEKPDRNREAEFDNLEMDKTELMALWEKGWQCLFAALESIREEELLDTIYIRSEAHTILDAVNRQLAHYPYHAGQIVYIAKWLKSDEWQSLSIPRGGTKAFNEEKFGRKL